jgi:hypothetical protein
LSGAEYSRAGAAFTCFRAGRFIAIGVVFVRRNILVRNKTMAASASKYSDANQIIGAVARQHRLLR